MVSGDELAAGQKRQPRPDVLGVQDPAMMDILTIIQIVLSAAFIAKVIYNGDGYWNR